MFSAILMLRRLAGALRVALREEDFARILGVAVATLTTSSVLDPDLTVTDPWLKVFTAGYVLVGIGILVEAGAPAHAP